MRKIVIVVLTGFFLFSYNFSFAQKKNFTYEQAFRGTATNITKSLPSIAGWADDDHYKVMQKDEASGKSLLMSVDVKSGKMVPYKQTEADKKSPATARTFIKENDIYFSDGTNEVRLTNNKETEINPTLSPDKKWIAFTRDNNLYAVEVATKKEMQFTSDGSDVILNGYASWVYFEEILGRRSRYKAFWWSPDSKHIAYMRFDDTQVPVFPIYVAEGPYGSLENERYPKAGATNPEVKVGITSIENAATVWANFNEKEDQYFGTPMWTPAGQLWVQWMNRGQDNLRIYAINLSNGSRQEIYHEIQSTWIDLDDLDRIEFLTSGKGFILKSDKDGWENLYLHDMTGKEINPITTGNFWGTSILKVDEKAKVIYFRARRENSARFDLYKTGLNGKGLTRLSFGEYSHDDINLSPGGKYFITTYSNVSTPTTMAIVDAKGKVVRELGNSKGADFENYNIPKTELVRVKSEDGLFDLPVSITYHVDFNSNKKYPVLIRIYGGPNAGTVYDEWEPVGGALQWLAQEGLVQVSIDNRSSGHFGKKGLNFIHRQLGKWEIEDYMACGKWLRAQNWVDTNRVGMTGGSFGGYLTCMALTYGADVFTHGVANASVTDWQLYDTHYTERYMDTPKENPEGYKNTSVMTYADKYKGLLRIVHGTTDDNVHMQNSIQLISKLQELSKHFEFMVYPGERHGIGASSAAKALHNRTETYRFFYHYLLNKPMPSAFGGSPQRRGF